MRVRLPTLDVHDAARDELGRRLLSDRMATRAAIRNYLMASVQADLDELVRAHEQRAEPDLPFPAEPAE